QRPTRPDGGSTNRQQVQVVEEAAAEGELQRLVRENATDQAGTRLDTKVIGQGRILEIRLDETDAPLRVVLSHGNRQPEADRRLALASDGAAHGQHLRGEADASTGVQAAEELVRA